MNIRKIIFTIFLALLFLTNTSYAKKNTIHTDAMKVKLVKKTKLRVPANASNKEYKFSYKYKGEDVILKSKSASFEDAFEKAAKECFHRYKGGRHLTEDEGLDIIDVCANPKS
jgi:hypothetical protein